MKTDSIYVCLKIPTETLSRFDELSNRTRRTRSFYMREALESSIDSLEKKYPERYSDEPSLPKHLPRSKA